VEDEQFHAGGSLALLAAASAELQALEGLAAEVQDVGRELAEQQATSPNSAVSNDAAGQVCDDGDEAGLVPRAVQRQPFLPVDDKQNCRSSSPGLTARLATSAESVSTMSFPIVGTLSTSGVRSQRESAVWKRGPNRPTLRTDDDLKRATYQ